MSKTQRPRLFDQLLIGATIVTIGMVAWFSRGSIMDLMGGGQPGPSGGQISMESPGRDADDGGEPPVDPVEAADRRTQLLEAARTALREGGGDRPKAAIGLRLAVALLDRSDAWESLESEALPEPSQTSEWQRVGERWLGDSGLDPEEVVRLIDDLGAEILSSAEFASLTDEAAKAATLEAQLGEARARTSGGGLATSLLMILLPGVLLLGWLTYGLRQQVSQVTGQLTDQRAHIVDLRGQSDSLYKGIKSLEGQTNDVMREVQAVPKGTTNGGGISDGVREQPLHTDPVARTPLAPEVSGARQWTQVSPSAPPAVEQGVELEDSGDARARLKSADSELFLVTPSGQGEGRLRVNPGKILSSPAHRGTIELAFDIEQQTGTGRFQTLEPAVCDWSEGDGRGFVRRKGVLIELPD